MVGVLADVPGIRFAYDTDGTLIRYKNPDTTFKEITNASIINDESATANTTTDLIEFWRAGQNGQNIQTVGPNSLGFATFIFPQLRNLAGYYAMFWSQSVSNTGQFRALQWSANTTDGSDGTWTEIASAFSGDFLNSSSIPSGTVIPNYRTRITPLSLTGVKGLRFGMSRDNTNFDTRDAHGFAAFHLYGSIPGSTGGVRMWHPTLDQEVSGAHFDFGDIPQGSITTKQFRVKNSHATLAATNTVIAVAANNLSDALMAQGMSLSLDNTTFGSTVTIASIASGAISPIIYVRRTVGPSEPSTARSARITAIPGSFA